jgi:hypothetical protein
MSYAECRGAQQAARDLHSCLFVWLSETREKDLLDKTSGIPFNVNLIKKVAAKGLFVVRLK